jgi:muramoyltetrapeptide carboxypeptidase
LAILTTLCGTNDDLNTAGKILFIEDIGEAVYAIDRMLFQLKKTGKLSGLKGLIVGGMTAMKDSAVPFGRSVQEVIKEAVVEFDFPVCFTFPAGHINDNRAIILGQKARLEVNDQGSVFTQAFDGF